ncbi:hypothetical protein ACJJTC_006200 [Scirpophaga incertulas]
MIWLVIFIVFIIVFHMYITRNANYWKVRGVKHLKQIGFFGSHLENFLMQRSITETFTNWYRLYPTEKVVGYFQGTRPGLIIRDPEIIKRILITDFAHFHKRGLLPDKAPIEPLLRNLFFADGDLWRLLRQRMTPAFTSGKLKKMFHFIIERAEQLQARTLAIARSGKTIDARDLMARYTTDVIGACGFGLDAESLNEEESVFRKLGTQIFEFSIRNAFVEIMKDLFPSVTENLKFIGNVEKPLFSLVHQILKERNYEPSDRNDFVDLLLEAKNSGLIEVESIEKINKDGTPGRATLELTEEMIAAQVFVFFAAGFETSSSATSYTLHQLAFNPEVQEKVQKELDVVLAKYNNKLSYETIKELTYLEWTFNEGMRLFPSLGYLARKCTKRYTIPEINLTIDEGVAIDIPLQALHTDPQYFDDPFKFCPDRFSPENTKQSNKYVYLPFGVGPRACIGERLGLMQSLAGLAAILSKFSVEPAPETKRHPPVKAQFDIVQNIADGIPLRFIERKPVT